MTAINATRGLWGPADPAPADAGPAGLDPICCWNLCVHISPVKSPRPRPDRHAAPAPSGGAASEAP